MDKISKHIPYIYDEDNIPEQNNIRKICYKKTYPVLASNFKTIDFVECFNKILSYGSGLNGFKKCVS